MKTLPLYLLLTSLAFPLLAHAAAVNLNSSDTGTQASFSTAGNWSNTAAPSAGNSYSVAGGLVIQTAADGTSYVFAGDSLTLGDGGPTAAILSYKGTASSTITVNNLIFNNGTFQNGVNSGTIIPTLAGTITLLGGGTFDMAGNNRNLTVTAAISGTGALTLENSVGGTPSATTGIKISAANSYTGPTTIAANTKVSFGNGNAFANSSSMTLNTGSVLELGSFTGSINNLSGTGTLDSNIASGGATLTINQTVSGTFAGAITSSAAGMFNITKSGSGTLTLAGANTFNNSLTINNGTIRLDASTGSLASTVTPKLGGSTFIYDNTNTSAVSKTLTLAGLNFISGGSTLRSILGGAASSTINITAFSITTSNPNSGATGNFVAADGVPGTTNSINLLTGTAGFQSPALFFNGADYAYLNSNGGYVRAPVYGTDAGFANASTTLVSGSHNRVASSITGQTAVTVNTVKFDTASEVDLSLSGLLTLTNGGLLRSGGGSTVLSGNSVTSGTGIEFVFRTDTASDNLTINSIVAATPGAVALNALVKDGAGTLTLGGVNTYQGVTYIDGGILSVSQNSNLGNQVSGAGLTINNGTLQATASFGLYQTSPGTHNRNLTLTNTADIDVTAGNTLTVSGTVSGAGNLVKSDSGTLALTGSGTYTGSTMVNGGALLVSGSLTGSGPVTVASGTLAGGGLINAATTVDAGGAIAPGLGQSAGNARTLTLSTGVTFQDGSLLAVNLDDGNDASDKLAITGNLNLLGDDTLSLDLINGTPATHEFVIATYTGALTGNFATVENMPSGYQVDYSIPNEIVIDVAAVPEPSTWMITLAGLGLVGYRLRRRSDSAPE